MTMKPNFEDLSCEMIFGQAPPPLEEDPALQQPCFAASQCHKAAHSAAGEGGAARGAAQH
jgi:hypothetical protein